MSAHFTTPTDELLLLAETLGEVKTKADKLEAEFATQARPLEAATNALSAALSGIKALQFHVLDNNLGALSARVEEMRKAVDEQVGVIALELKKADETNAAKAGQEAEALRSEIAALQAQLGTLGAQFSAQLERVEFSAKEEAKKLQLIPGPAGAAGASLNPRGTFVDGETYNRLDVVSWLGSSYIAAVDGVTEKPSKNSNQWQVLASRGSGGSGGAGDFGSLAGVAQINQGGTGQTTRAAGLNALLPDQAGATQYMLLTDGAGTVSWGAQPVAGLPSQTSNGGKLLTTDGTNASWSNAVTVSGSNATVTGTLTVNGSTLTSAGSLLVNGATSAALFSGQATVAIKGGSGGAAIYLSDATGSTPGATSPTLHFASSTDGISLRASSGVFQVIDETQPGAGDGSLRLSVTNAGVVSIPATTASTTTSSGALVVSGGVGIGGSLNAGANNAANSITGGDAGSGTSILQLKDGLGSVKVNFKGNGDVAVQSSTASTSTSSGALVVSGGVGVAGAINAGGNIVTSQSSDPRVTVQRTGLSLNTQSQIVLSQGSTLFGASDRTYQVLSNGESGTAAYFGVQYWDGSNYSLRLKIDSAGATTFGGSLTTSAPSGGTAAAWKLGTVATVSPTSPNRTIEVDIGGTIYYIHAKTTNN